MCQKSITLRNWASTHKPDCHFSLQKAKQMQEDRHAQVARNNGSPPTYMKQQQVVRAEVALAINDITKGIDTSKKRKAPDADKLGKMSKLLHEKDTGTNSAECKATENSAKALAGMKNQQNNNKAIPSEADV